jgi:hypothetical protein
MQTHSYPAYSDMSMQLLLIQKLLLGKIEEIEICVKSICFLSALRLLLLKTYSTTYSLCNLKQVTNTSGSQRFSPEQQQQLLLAWKSSVETTDSETLRGEPVICVSTAIQVIRTHTQVQEPPADSLV